MGMLEPESSALLVLLAVVPGLKDVFCQRWRACDSVPPVSVYY
jgi:hypothetical protein